MYLVKLVAQRQKPFQATFVHFSPNVSLRVAQCRSRATHLKSEGGGGDFEKTLAIQQENLGTKKLQSSHSVLKPRYFNEIKFMQHLAKQNKDCQKKNLFPQQSIVNKWSFILLWRVMCPESPCTCWKAYLTTFWPKHLGECLPYLF